MNNNKTTPTASLLFKNTRLSTCIITLQSRFISCGCFWWSVIRWMVVVGLADRNGVIIPSLLISSSILIITILLLLVLWVKSWNDYYCVLLESPWTALSLSLWLYLNPVSVCLLLPLQINLRLILVSGKTKEFLFGPADSAGDIAQTVYDNWPDGE